MVGIKGASREDEGWWASGASRGDEGRSRKMRAHVEMVMTMQKQETLLKESHLGYFRGFKGVESIKRRWGRKGGNWGFNCWIASPHWL